MTHFALVVVGDNVEEQLTPFQEYSGQEYLKEFLVFHDITEETRKYWLSGTQGMVRLADGSMANPWDEQFWKRVSATDPTVTPIRTQARALGAKAYRYNRDGDEHVLEIRVFPENAQEIQVPLAEYEPDFEKFIASRYNKDPKTGQYGYFTNANGKWDYWNEGGRWDGFFRLHPTEAGFIGNSNSALKREIDFDSTRRQAEQQAAKGYDELLALHQKHGDADKDAFFNAVLDNPLLMEAGIFPFDMDDILAKGRAAYIRQCGLLAGVPFALLYEGQWFEQDTNKPKGGLKEFAMRYHEVLAQLPDDTRLTIVDCHA